MRNLFITFFLPAFIFLIQATATAQVTIGATIEPAPGALLDLKEQLPDAGNITAKNGGLLLPRVEIDSLSDFSLIQNPTPEQKKNHTGLLVYNLKTDEKRMLEKGIYQWDGEKWRMLKKITKTESVAVKKKIYTAEEVDENKVLSIGVFDFRMYARSNGCYPQFRLNSGNQTIYWQVTDYWDMNTSLEAANLTDTGYSFSLVSSLNTDPTAWNDLKGSVNPTRKSEVWMADLQNDHMYQIQFVILRSGPFTSSPTTYVIIAKRY